jgi:hypothetical protein
MLFTLLELVFYIPMEDTYEYFGVPAAPILRQNFRPDKGGNMFLQKVGTYLPN